MTTNLTTFTIADPLHFDGDAYEVAERASKQASAVARALAGTVDSAATMARNAQLSRNLTETPDDARADEWEDSAQSRRFSRVHHQVKEIETALTQLSAAAGFNPKAPLPKE